MAAEYPLLSKLYHWKSFKYSVYVRLCSQENWGVPSALNLWNPGFPVYNFHQKLQSVTKWVETLCPKGAFWRFPGFTRGKYSFSSPIPSIQWVSGRFAYGSFCLRSVRLRIESIRLRLVCQFAYESDVEALNLNYEKSLFLVLFLPFYPGCLEKQRAKTSKFECFKNFIMAEPGRLRIECVKDICKTEH